MNRHIAVLSVILGALLGACGTTGEAPSTGGPTGQLRVSLQADSPLVTIAIRNVFDHSQVYLIDCQQKAYTLNGATFCDQLTVLPPGVYEIIVQTQDPNCQTEYEHYKVIVEEGQTVEVPITMVCEGVGGLDVVVTTRNRPAITGLSFLGANKFICKECGDESGDVRVEVQVTDPDTACAALVPTWTAVNSGGMDVTSTLLSGFQLVDGDPCRFSALIDAGAPLGDYNITFGVSDGTTQTSTITFPVHIIDCGCTVLHHNTANATASYDGGTLTASDEAYFISDGGVASADGGTHESLPPCAVTNAGAAAPAPNLGNLDQYLFFFADGSVDANWQGATKGFIGNVAVDGISASERTSGTVPYAGTIYTNDTNLGAWLNIVNDPVNAGQAFGVTGAVSRISGLETDLSNAFAQINALPATAGFTSIDSSALDCLNTINGVAQTIVINVTSGFSITNQLYVYGDATDIFVLRWDTDANPLNGYQGEVKFSSGGAIVPCPSTYPTAGCGLKPSNFINVAGDISSSGGGSNPPPPYPQGPRYNDGTGALINDGANWNGGGFFTGYWLTTGDPATGETHSLSNAIFVGGWYTTTDKFSMTSGTSGVYVSPPLLAGPGIDLEKYVSPDNGLTWYDADFPTGPNVLSGTNPRYRFVVTNTGDVTLTNVTVTDSVMGSIGVVPTLLPGGSFTFDGGGTGIAWPWAPDQQSNLGTATGTPPTGPNVTDTDPAHYVGVTGSISVKKYVWDGASWQDAQLAPGVFLTAGPVQYRYVVTNTGTTTLTNVTLTDDILGPIPLPGNTLDGGDIFDVFPINATWAAGEHTNVGLATGDDPDGNQVRDDDPANYFGGALAPGLVLQKYVSIDEGLTWYDADSPTGPFLPSGVVPWFWFQVTNTGTLPLYDVTVTDTVFGTVGSVPLLNAGESADFYRVGLP